jgi:predicted membrane protein
MENTELKNNFRSHGLKGLGFGLILIAIGLVFLGTNAGFISEPLRRVLISWQMLLIVIGVSKLFKREYFSATMLFIIGTFFLLPRIFRAFPETFPGLDGSFTHVYWPLLLIASGILLIMNKLYGKPWGYYDHKHSKCNNSYKHANYVPGSFSKNSIFGGGEHIVLEPDFKGGDVNAVFGGITLDLRHTNLVEGTSRLEVNAVFGGVTIMVPNDWFIETNIDTVFGGFEDKRMIKAPLNTDRKLIISGACVFGGGELSN